MTQSEQKSTNITYEAQSFEPRYFMQLLFGEGQNGWAHDTETNMYSRTLPMSTYAAEREEPFTKQQRESVIGLLYALDIGVQSTHGSPDPDPRTFTISAKAMEKLRARGLGEDGWEELKITMQKRLASSPHIPDIHRPAIANDQKKVLDQKLYAALFHQGPHAWTMKVVEDTFYYEHRVPLAAVDQVMGLYTSHNADAIEFYGSKKIASRAAALFKWHTGIKWLEVHEEGGGRAGAPAELVFSAPGRKFEDFMAAIDLSKENPESVTWPPRSNLAVLAARRAEALSPASRTK